MRGQGRIAVASGRRGVEEVELRAKDWRGFEVTDCHGKCIQYVEWPAADATQKRIDWLWEWLDAEDPQPVKPHLELVKVLR